MPAFSTIGNKRPREVVFIQNFRDAEALIRWRRTGFTPQFVVRIQGASTEDSRRWESALNQVSQECGCVLGARCALASLCLIVAWGFLQRSNPAHTKLVFVRELLVAVVLGSILGKVLGMLRAKIRIFRIAREMKTRWKCFGEEDCDSELRTTSPQTEDPV